MISMTDAVKRSATLDDEERDPLLTRVAARPCSHVEVFKEVEAILPYLREAVEMESIRRDALKEKLAQAIRYLEITSGLLLVGLEKDLA